MRKRVGDYSRVVDLLRTGGGENCTNNVLELNTMKTTGIEMKVTVTCASAYRKLK